MVQSFGSLPVFYFLRVVAGEAALSLLLRCFLYGVGTLLGFHVSCSVPTIASADALDS